MSCLSAGSRRISNLFLESAIGPVELWPWLIVDKGGNVVGLLRCEDAHTILGHVVLDKGSHFTNAVHTCSVVEGADSPQWRYEIGVAFTLAAVTSSALSCVNLSAMERVGFEVVQIDKASPNKGLAVEMRFGKPLNIIDDGFHLRAVVVKRNTIFATNEALFDTVFECDVMTSGLAVHREEFGDADNGRGERLYSAFCVTTGASDLRVGVFRTSDGSLIEQKLTPANAVAEL
jgi:hypothetical protein